MFRGSSSRDRGKSAPHQRGEHKRPSIIKKGNGSRRIVPTPTREAKKPSTNARVRLNVAITGVESHNPTHPICQKCLASEDSIARQKCIRKMTRALPKNIFQNAIPIDLLVRSNGDKHRVGGRIRIGGSALKTPCDTVGIIPFQNGSGCKEFGPLCPLICKGISSPTATEEGRAMDLLSAVLGYQVASSDIIDLDRFGE